MLLLVSKRLMLTAGIEERVMGHQTVISGFHSVVCKIYIIQHYYLFLSNDILIFCLDQDVC